MPPGGRSVSPILIGSSRKESRLAPIWLSLMLDLYHRHLNGTGAVIRRVMVGANDIERSRRFHGAVLGTLAPGYWGTTSAGNVIRPAFRPLARPRQASMKTHDFRYLQISAGDLSRENGRFDGRRSRAVRVWMDSPASSPSMRDCRPSGKTPRRWIAMDRCIFQCYIFTCGCKVGGSWCSGTADSRALCGKVETGFPQKQCDNKEIELAGEPEFAGQALVRKAFRVKV